jgi:predicted cupin superfamily sugar epimerase
MPQFTKPTTINQVWASAGIISAPANLKITQGWSVEIPPYQYFNWSQNRVDSFMAHINQMGISVWDQTTEYQAGKSYVQGSDGVIYKAKTTHTNIDPANPLNGATWERAFEEFGSVAVVDGKITTLQTNYNTLANIANYPQARQNLSVWSRVEADNRYAYKAGESTQVFAVANATQNSHAIPLGQLNSLLQQATTTIVGTARIATATEVEQGTLDNVIVVPTTANSVFLKKSQNLADVPNKAAARTNLGLTEVATTSLNDFLLKSGNLAGLTNVVTARTNLGLGTLAVENAIDWLPKSGNLSGLTNVATARNNLGLGNSATRDVGTSAGSVAAGDDTRIVNAVQNTRNLTAGNGLTGGGSFAADRTISLGTPGTISASSGNAATSTSHTHAFDITSFFSERVLEEEGMYTFPGGFMIQWGRTPLGGSSAHSVIFTTPFKSACFGIQVTQVGTTTAQDAHERVINFSNTGATIAKSTTNSYLLWVAYGV